jgi:hypothetical protein
MGVVHLTFIVVHLIYSAGGLYKRFSWGFHRSQVKFSLLGEHQLGIVNLTCQ